jgi:dipeptide/tripeptide permease
MSAIVELQVDNKNYISMLWQLPQFFMLAMAEIFTYLAHINFAYKEAPVSMKPVIVAFLYLTIATGDFIVAIISGISLFKSQFNEYLFFAFLMLLDVLILCYLTHRYKCTDHEMIRELDEEERSDANKTQTTSI